MDRQYWWYERAGVHFACGLAGKLAGFLFGGTLFKKSIIVSRDPYFSCYSQYIHKKTIRLQLLQF